MDLLFQSSHSFRQFLLLTFRQMDAVWIWKIVSQRMDFSLLTVVSGGVSLVLEEFAPASILAERSRSQ